MLFHSWFRTLASDFWESHFVLFCRVFVAWPSFQADKRYFHISDLKTFLSSFIVSSSLLRLSFDVRSKFFCRSSFSFSAFEVFNSASTFSNRSSSLSYSIRLWLCCCRSCSTSLVLSGILFIDWLSCRGFRGLSPHAVNFTYFRHRFGNVPE